MGAGAETAEPPPTDASTTSSPTSGGQSTDPIDGDTGSSSRGPSTGDPTTSGDTTGDIETGDAESDSTEGRTDSDATETGSEPDDTIYDIRQGEVPLNSMVEVRDVIVTGVGSNGFYVQEPMSGMFSGTWVFTGMGGPPPPALGDVVDLAGVHEEFFGLTEINVAEGSVTVTATPGAGNVPSAQVLAPAELGEPWEGVFVRIQNDTFEVAEIGAGPQNDFRVTDTSGVSMWVDDNIYDAEASGDFPGFAIGSTFVGIQGPVGFAFDEFRIAPRAMGDLSGYQQ